MLPSGVAEAVERWYEGFEHQRGDKMKYFLAIALVFGASQSMAECFGSDSFQTCYDGSGNSYTVNRYGNTTSTNGYNAQTGSTWSQQSHTYGNITQHNGASNGNSWNMTQTQNGFGQTFSGTDSGGNSFHTTCDAFGNCY